MGAPVIVPSLGALLRDIKGLSLSQGDILHFDGTNITNLGPGTAGYLLKTQGAGADPVWVSPPFPGGVEGNIPFPATAVPAADANTLDDYEEGTWTPVLTFETAGDLSVAYTIQAGFYRKIGDMVWFQFYILTSTFTHSTTSGGLQISGLPFTSDSGANTRGRGTGRWQGITKANYTQVDCVVTNNGTAVAFQASGSAQANADVTVSDTPTGGTMRLEYAGFYHV